MMNHLEKIALSPALLRRAGNVAKQKASNILKATEVAPPGALKDLTTRMGKRLTQSEKFLSAAKRKPQTPPKLKSVATNQLSDPIKIPGSDPKHVDSLRIRLMNKLQKEGLSETDAWNEAMSFGSLKDMYKELGMASATKKPVAKATWTGTKGYGLSKASSAFIKGFEKKASQHTEEMEKEAFVSKVIPWLGRTAGRVVGKFRGVARPKGGFAPIQGHVTRSATPKATSTAIPGKTRRMSLGEQIHQAKGEYGAASRGMHRTQWAAGKKELGGRDWASQRKQMLAQGEEVAAAKDAARAERLAAREKAKADAAAKAQQQKKAPEAETPEKPADQSMLDSATNKAKEGWEGTKKWWGELQPETKTYIKGAGLVGGGVAAGHLLTRSGDNSKVSYGPSYGV